VKYWPSIGATLLIFLAVLLPGGNLPRVDFPHFDKYVHIAMFFVWAIAMRTDFSGLRVWQLVLLGISFGLFTEFLQFFTEHRSFDILDFVADSVGIALGYYAAPFVMWIVKKILP
jgi:glycopeptide antibiotics resistance protein